MLCAIKGFMVGQKIANLYDTRGTAQLGVVTKWLHMASKIM